MVARQVLQRVSKQQHQLLIERVLAEHGRQAGLPGSEWDATNTPGEWVALISHYVGSEVRRNGIVPSAESFEDTLIKAAAVIVTALEHIEVMKSRDELL